jgi:hypothetical protein
MRPDYVALEQPDNRVGEMLSTVREARRGLTGFTALVRILSAACATLEPK